MTKVCMLPCSFRMTLYITPFNQIQNKIQKNVESTERFEGTMPVTSWLRHLISAYLNLLYSCKDAR